MPVLLDSMDAVFLVSHSLNCETFWRSWTCLDNTCHAERYDLYSHDRQHELIELVRARKPDVVVYVGAIEQYYNRPVPTLDTLKRIHDLVPSILFCCDAGDDYWWEWLNLYNREQCFSAQANIDGNFNTPLAGFSNGIVKLTPTDPSLFSSLPWHERSIFLGMAGADGHPERNDFMRKLSENAQFDQRHGMPPQEMGTFLGQCKIIPNHPITGTGKGMHVKGRIIEAGWAGAVCLEKANPATSAWFSNDLYLQYNDTEDALQKLAWARDNDGAVKSMAERFHSHVAEHHHPSVFWRDVLAKAKENDSRLQ